MVLGKIKYTCKRQLGRKEKPLSSWIAHISAMNWSPLILLASKTVYKFTFQISADFPANQLPRQSPSWRYGSEKQLLHVTVEKSRRETKEKEQEEELILFIYNSFKFIPLLPASHWRAAFLWLAIG